MHKAEVTTDWKSGNKRGDFALLFAFIFEKSVKIYLFPIKKDAQEEPSYQSLSQ